MTTANKTEITHQGFLVLADIAGYTAFLAGTELEHAHGIIDELVSLIRSRLDPPLRFVKLEGDCVFCYAEAHAFADRPELLIEIIESCYFDFASRLLDMQRSTTCQCRACSAINTLDLKFVVHYGSFIVQRADRSIDLLGTDVIVAHRLLKNSIEEQHGTRAYAFFSAACLAHIPGAAFPAHSETYESLGTIRGGAHDLAEVERVMRASRHVFIGEDDSDFGLTCEVEAPLAVVWDAWIDPRKRQQWQPDLTNAENHANSSGRMGSGASSHCAHGSAVILHEYVDWRPFQYFTEASNPVRGLMAPPAMTTTVDFSDAGAGKTLVHMRCRLRDRNFPSMLRYRLLKPVISRMMKRYSTLLADVARSTAGEWTAERDGDIEAQAIGGDHV